MDCPSPVRACESNQYGNFVTYVWSENRTFSFCFCFFNPEIVSYRTQFISNVIVVCGAFVFWSFHIGLKRSASFMFHVFFSRRRRGQSLIRQLDHHHAHMIISSLLLFPMISLSFIRSRDFLWEESSIFSLVSFLLLLSFQIRMKFEGNFTSVIKPAVKPKIYCCDDFRMKVTHEVVFFFSCCLTGESSHGDSSIDVDVLSTLREVSPQQSE